VQGIRVPRPHSFSVVTRLCRQISVTYFVGSDDIASENIMVSQS
jgi:hypothetical protein